MEMEITRYAFAHLSKDDDHYQEKLAALHDAGFWFDPVKDRWIKPEPLLEGEEVLLQYFSAEGVCLDRNDICRRKMLFFLLKNGFEYDEPSDRWFRPKDRNRWY